MEVSHWGHQPSSSLSTTKVSHQNSMQSIPTGSPHNSSTVARGQTSTTSRPRGAASTISTGNARPIPTSTSQSFRLKSTSSPKSTIAPALSKASSKPQLSSSTSKAPPPPPPPPPPPEPPEGVATMYEITFRPADRGGRGGQWVMLEGDGEDSAFEVCDATRPGEAMQSRSWIERPCPISIKVLKPAHGHKNCKYSGNDNGPGRFSCDGVAEFACVKDPYYGSITRCGQAMNQRSFGARVVCWFPRG